MWQIEEDFIDPFHPTGKGLIVLKSNQVLNPNSISYPITWTGLINNEEVKIIQKSRTLITLSDLEFIDIPKQYAHLKHDILDWLRKCLRTLN